MLAKVLPGAVVRLDGALVEGEGDEPVSRRRHA